MPNKRSSLAISKMDPFLGPQTSLGMYWPFATAQVLVPGRGAVLGPAGAGAIVCRRERPEPPTIHARDVARDERGAQTVRESVPRAPSSPRLRPVHGWIREAWDRLGPRAVPLSIVLCIHALLVAAMLTSPLRTKTTVPAVPIQVRMIAEPRAVQSLSPPPAVSVPQQKIDVPLPSLMPVEHPPVTSKAITVPVAAPAAAPSTAPAAAPSPVVTAPRFDADYLSNPAPAYPAMSRRLREEGTVLLRVLVRKNGDAAQVLIEQSSGFARLDQAARGTVTRWRFVPARDASGPVEDWVLVPIEFSLRR